MFDAQALLAGDENALADAVDALSPELYRYAAGILLNSHDAQDAVQCAFVSLWKNRASVKNPDAVRAYLYRCTCRAAVDVIRRKRLYVPLPGREEKIPLSEEMARALSELSPADRALVYERAVAETSYAELAERFGVREDAVRKRYERAKKKLAKALGQTEQGGKE